MDDPDGDPALLSARIARLLAAEGLHDLGDAACAERALRDRTAALRDSLGSRTPGSEPDPAAAPDPVLVLMAQRYVDRFATRHEVLRKQLRESAEDLAGGNWATTVRITLERPFATVAARCVFGAIVLVACASATGLLLQTVPRYNPRLFPDLRGTWLAVDLALAALFVLELAVRCAATLLDATFPSCIAAVLHLACNPWTYADAVSSFLPFALLPWLNPEDSPRVIASVSLLRLVRVLVPLRHFDNFEDLLRTLRRSAPPLVGPLLTLLVVLVAISSLLFTVEGGSLDDETLVFNVRDSDCEMTAAFVLGRRLCFRRESEFTSVVHALWYSFVTFLTVGFGDMIPFTVEGRALGSLTVVLGVLMTAVPIAIVGTSFTVTIEQLRAERGRVAEQRRRDEALRSEGPAIEEAAAACAHDPALPTAAWQRCMRLGLRRDTLDLDDPAQAADAAFMTDTLCARAGEALLRDEHADLAREAALAPQWPRSDATRRWALELDVGSSHHRVPIAAASTLLRVGASADCEVCVTALLQEASAAAEKGRGAAHHAVRPQGVASVHCTLQLGVDAVGEPCVAVHPTERHGVRLRHHRSDSHASVRTPCGGPADAPAGPPGLTIAAPGAVLELLDGTEVVCAALEIEFGVPVVAKDEDTVGGSRHASLISVNPSFGT